MNGLKYAVCVTDEQAGVTAPIMLRGPFDLCFRQAAECGYDGVELQIKDPLTRDAAELLRLMGRYHLEISAIATGMEYFGNGLCLISGDQTIQDRAVARLREHVELAETLGCKVIFGSMRGVINDFAKYEQLEARLIRNLDRVLEAAERRGVDVVIEPINLYVNNYINTLAEGAAFVEKMGPRRLGLHIDTHHMRIHDGDMYEAILRYRSLIRYVHYSDSNRWYPGGGNIDFLQCTKALLTAGYGGWVAMECLPLEDGRRSAEKALRYCRRLEEACRELMA